MSSGRGRTPSWLYSFVDLAFLLLITLSQLDVDLSDQALDLGDIAVPEIVTTAAEDLPPEAQRRWQLRVHPPEEADVGPFTLALRAGSAPGQEAEQEERLDLAALQRRLAGLREAQAAKPLLAPHQDSRSHDLLAAAASLEERWPSGRRAMIAPVSAGP